MIQPLRVRQLSHALQQKVIGLLDLSDPHVLGAKPDEPRVLTRALAAVTVWDQVGCSLEEAAASVVDGGKDGGIDAIYVQQQPPRLYLVQSKWRSPGNATLNADAVNSLSQGYDDLNHDRFDDFNDRIRAFRDPVRQVQNDPNCKIIVVMALLGDDAVHPDQRRALKRLETKHGEGAFEFRYLHLRDFHPMVKSGLSLPTIELQVTLQESFRRKQSGKQPESYTGTVRARDVFDWVERYGSRLFDQNVRGSLGNTTVNEKIRGTLQSTPELFFTLNKGLTLIANRVDKAVANSGAYSDPAHLTLLGASVVDGAQTVTQVHTVLTGLRGSGASGEALIPVRVISLDGAPHDLAKRITMAANTQNAILARDFAGNDDVQEELQLELDALGKRYIYRRSVDAPKPDAQTCTIFEVARALVCMQKDAALVARIKHNPDTLWEREPGGIYEQLFLRGTPDAREAWNGAVFVRAVLGTMDRVAARRRGRAEAIAQQANLLIAHLLLRLTDAASIREADESEWAHVITAATARCDEVLDSVIVYTTERYSDDQAAKTFTDGSRVKLIASQALAALRMGTIATPQSPADQRPKRAPNTVAYLVDHDLIPEGTVLTFKSHTISRRKQVDAWTEAHPDECRAYWVANRKTPLRWGSDGKRYAPSPLAVDILEHITGARIKSVRGPDCWTTPDGRTLNEIMQQHLRGEADQ
ncbi:AIPR family protein [Glycomyces sp. NPDC047010]|uniref:AIPR family protein n=1 Tax=Glycomyces sp. NPDC047010 TaxID=3155023 RepID=UPI0033D73226